MADVIYGSLAKIDKSDIEAIAEYLKTRDPGSANPQPEPVKLSEQQKKSGRAIYEEQCMNCHGKDGSGAEGLAANLSENQAITSEEGYNILSVLLEGIAPRGKWGKMPSYADTLTNQEIADVTNYVRAEFAGGSANILPGDVSSWRRVVSEPAEGLENTITCPNVPAKHVDEQLTSSLKEISSDRIDKTKLRSVVEDYAKRFPDLEEGQRQIAMTSIYCREIASELPSRRDVTRQQLRFMYALSDVTAGFSGNEKSNN